MSVNSTVARTRSVFCAACQDRSCSWVPGEGLHVLARGNSVPWPVGEHGDAGLEGPGVDQLQVGDVGRVAEQTLATSKHHGKHHEPVLVDQVMVDERVEKVGAAKEQDVTARLLFQLSDLLGGISPDDA